MAAAADSRAEAAALAAECAQMQERKETAQSDRTAAAQQLETARQEAKANRRALEDAQEEAQAVGNIIAGHTLRMEERKKKGRRGHRSADEADHGRRGTGKPYPAAYGDGEGVRGILPGGEDGDAGRAACLGNSRPVASLMKTDSRYSLAVEIALGAGLQNIVVDREEDAKAAIGFLKRKDAGRATFLPLSAIRGEELHQPGVESEFGFVGPGRPAWVRFDAQYGQIFRSLLGRTVIVEDLDCGHCHGTEVPAMPSGLSRWTARSSTGGGLHDRAVLPAGPPVC